MKVPLLDLEAQYESIREEVLRVTAEVYESQQFILGTRVENLEKAIARYCAVPYAVGASSGTDALLMSLMAAGIGPGDSVITTPYTFFATAGVISRCGARPVFADIEPDTYNLSPEATSRCIGAMARRDRESLKGILPVHLFGQCADMDSLRRVAKDHSLTVIEDAAQAIGATFAGRPAGSMGDFGCFSFYPSKNLGAFGDGGMVTTGTRERYEKLRVLRDHGQCPKYTYRMIGGNFRLDALQAAIVSVKFRYLDRWTRTRERKAVTYRSLFADAGLAGRMILPCNRATRHVYNYFVIQVPERRDELRAALQAAGIGTDVYYPVPLHLQKCFSSLGYRRGDFPVAEHAAQHTLSLPIYPELTDEKQAYVVDEVRAFYA